MADDKINKAKHAAPSKQESRRPMSHAKHGEGASERMKQDRKPRQQRDDVQRSSAAQPRPAARRTEQAIPEINANPVRPVTGQVKPVSKQPSNNKRGKSNKPSKGNKKKFRTLTIIQAVCAVVIVVCLAFLGVKFMQYNSARSLYNDMALNFTDKDGTGELNIDWAKLQEAYPEVVAWIQIPDINLSYPVVQGDDNDKYLHESPDGEYCISGSIFLDYRNSPTLTDSHILIYGHNMLDESMFSHLVDFEDSDLLKNGSGKVIVYTPTATRHYRIFSVLEVSPFDEVVEVELDEEELAELVQSLIDRALYDTGVRPLEGAQLLTLSTCANDTVRFIVNCTLTDRPEDAAKMAGLFEGDFDSEVENADAYDDEESEE